MILTFFLYIAHSGLILHRLMTEEIVGVLKGRATRTFFFSFVFLKFFFAETVSTQVLSAFLPFGKFFSVAYFVFCCLGTFVFENQLEPF